MHLVLLRCRSLLIVCAAASALCATSRGGGEEVERLLRYLESARAPSSQILITARDVLELVRLDQIVYVEALEKCTLVRTVEEASETDASLADLEARLPASGFIPIHRSHIVHRRYIAALRRWETRQLKVERRH
jgi:DNA-binding LytR/AlgR family response regulator